MHLPSKAVFICLGALVLTSCLDDGGRQGIPTDPPKPTTTQAAPAPQPTQPAPTTSTTAAAPATTSANRPDPAWLAEVEAGDLAALKRRCWTIAPATVDKMYADADGITAALAAPNWAGPRKTLQPGNPCPTVTDTGVALQYTGADARHVVRRYLSRFTGKPLNPADVEGTYPVVCSASVLANNPGVLTGVTAFRDAEIASASQTLVTAPVTNAAGAVRFAEFTMQLRPDGYCIANVVL